jgi:hypothetical protein
VGFLDLPRELRDIIYEFAFHIKGAVFVYSRDPFKALNMRHGGKGLIEPRRLRNDHLPVALFRTFRQLRAESSLVFYGTNVLYFSAQVNIDVGLANRCLVRHIMARASPCGINDNGLDYVSYCWKREFWPEILHSSGDILERYPNLDTLTYLLKPRRSATWRPTFFERADKMRDKTREQRVDLVASWMGQMCVWEDERLRRILHLEMSPPPGSRFVPGDVDYWDCTELFDAFERMKSSV